MGQTGTRSAPMEPALIGGVKSASLRACLRRLFLKQHAVADPIGHVGLGGDLKIVGNDHHAVTVLMGKL